MSIHFHFSTANLDAAVKKALAEHPQMARRAMSDVSVYLQREARLRAPVDEGELTVSISAGVERRWKGFAAVVYVPSNSPASQYAIPMHEHVYQLGENSQAKQEKVAVRVGGGYLTRAITENMEMVVEIIKRVLRRR